MWLHRLFRSEPTRPPVPLAEDGRRVFVAAVRAARRDGYEYVSTTHQLIGVVEAGPSPALDVLHQAGITPAAVRGRCAVSPGLGQESGPLPLTPHAERVLAAAWRAAESRGAGGARALDLLIALARETEGEARQMLIDLAPDNQIAEGDTTSPTVPESE